MASDVCLSLSNSSWHDAVSFTGSLEIQFEDFRSLWLSFNLFFLKEIVLCFSQRFRKIFECSLILRYLYTYINRSYLFTSKVPR